MVAVATAAATIIDHREDAEDDPRRREHRSHRSTKGLLRSGRYSSWTGQQRGDLLDRDVVVVFEGWCWCLVRHEWRQEGGELPLI